MDSIYELLSTQVTYHNVKSKMSIKEAQYIARQEQLNATTNPTLLSYIGQYFTPMAICAGALFVGSYLYHRLLPYTTLIPHAQCSTILQQLYRAWTIAITESSRQEQKLLEDYKHLHEQQQLHLVQVLRASLLNDLLLTEDTIFKIHGITKQQFLYSIDYYTSTKATIPLENAEKQAEKIESQKSLLSSAADLYSSSISTLTSKESKDTEQSHIQLPDLKMVKTRQELLRFVHLVLPTPELPTGWSVHDVLEILSQWFELRLVVMEKTYNALGYASLRENGAVLTTEQLKELNTVYMANIAQQIEVFCAEKGLSQSFLNYLNKCVINDQNYLALTQQYRDQQQARFAPLGLMVSESTKR